MQPINRLFVNSMYTVHLSTKRDLQLNLMRVKLATRRELGELKSPLTSGFLLFLTLCIWSISGPLTSGYDSTFHLANIWCANGNQAGICEDIAVSNNGIQGRIPASLTSESVESGLVNADLTASSRKSPFYRIMHFFVSDNTTLSVLLIRFVNSFFAGLIFFCLMFFSVGKTRTAILSAWTFSIIPIVMATLWQSNPRSWGYLSVMSCWAFLYLALNSISRNPRYPRLIWIPFTFSLFLALTSRVDAAVFTIFSCTIVLSSYLIKTGVIRVGTFSVVALLAMFAFYVVRAFSSTLSWYTQFSFGSLFVDNEILFVLIHLPENIADGLGLGLRYVDLGPDAIGIIGVSLYCIALASWLKQSTPHQVIIVVAGAAFMFLAMFQIAFNWPEMNEASGVYVTALLTVLLGFAATYSRTTDYFPNSKAGVSAIVLLLSISHALSLYSKFEWGVRSDIANNTYTNLSLNGGWWWDIPIGPNWFYWFGVFCFPAWLSISWKLALQQKTTALKF